MLAVLTLACGLLGPGSASADDLDDRMAAARAALVKALEREVAWCQENKVFAERDRVYETILLVSPDHERARTVLKYTRRKKGAAWEQKDYVPPKNWNKGMIAEAAKRLGAALGGYRDAVQAAVAEAGEGAPGERLERLREHLVDLMPDDADLRRSRGDVERGGRWFLPETVEGIARREAFRAMLGRAKRALPAVRPDPDAVRKRWRSGVATERFAVYGYVDEEECVELVRLLETGHAFMAELMGPSDEPPSLARVLLMESPDVARTWLQAQGPEYDEAKRSFEHLAALWLPSGANMRYHPDATARRVGAARHLLNGAVDQRVSGDRDRGWVSEGLGQRLCWHLAGRHGAAIVAITQTETAADRDVETILPDTDGEWLTASARVLADDPVPKVRAVLTMRLNAMRIDDVLVGYALGAYLLEGRPEALTTFVTSAQSTDDPDKQCVDVFGVDSATLAWRLRRWTLETTSL